MIVSYIKNYIDNINLESYYANNSVVNYPFIISLKRDVGKYENAVRVLGDIGMSKVIKFPAIYGKDLKISDPDIYGKFSGLNSGEVGCFLSHVSVYYIASLHKYSNQYTLIFEDDIEKNYNFGFGEFRRKVEDVVRYNADMIYLGKCCEKCSGMIKLKEDIYYGVKPKCLHAYMIRNSFARKVVDYIGSLERINLPIDMIFGNMLLQNKIIIFHPSLFRQKYEYVSNLRGKMYQKLNNYECYEDFFPSVLHGLDGYVYLIPYGLDNLENYEYLILYVYILMVVCLIIFMVLYVYYMQ